MLDTPNALAPAINALLRQPGGNHTLNRILERHGLRTMGLAAFDAFVGVAPEGPVRTAAIIDVETTGFDPRNDHVIEVAILLVAYASNGIVELISVNSCFNDPGVPIPPEITRLTGITQAMVTGQTLTDAWFHEHLAEACVVVAHNAEFDRMFLEHSFAGVGFDRRPWLCSASDIAWDARGETSRKLELLALHAGLVYGSHRASDDIIATAHVLNCRHSGAETTPFAEMLARGRLETMTVMAENAPFEAKDVLKDRGYVWSPGCESYPFRKCWHRDILAIDTDVATEVTFLRSDVYKASTTVPVIYRNAFQRYSTREGRRGTLSL